MAEARLWLLLPGLTLSMICEEIRQIMEAKSDGPPSTFRYFTKAMQRLAGALVAEPLVPIAGRKPTAQAKPSGHEWKLNAADFNPDGSLRQ